MSALSIPVQKDLVVRIERNAMTFLMASTK